jgi:predicted Zn finger-like uncharacterized protein
MVVECEGCGTRFNLADGQVPEGGARVRCSKCHHRFVVTPSGAPPASLTEQDTPAPSDSAREEPSLDNPEFLFDDAPPSEPDDPAEEVEDGDLTQNPDLEQTMIADAPSEDADEADDYEDDDEEIFGDEDDDSVPSLPSAVLPTPTQVTATEAMDNAPPADFAEDDSDRSDFGGANELIGGESEVDPSAGEEDLAAAEAGDLDDLGEDWDGKVDADPLSSWDSLLDGDGPAPAPIEAPRPAPKAEVKTRRAPEPLAVADDPRLSSDLVDRVSGVLAIAAGLLLAIGGVRAVSQNALGPTPGPGLVRGAGWAAAEIDSLQLRDAAGRRVVVVRGSLSAPGERKVPPRVRAVLLDAAGDPVGNPFEGHLERLSAEQLTPDALSKRLTRRGPRAAGAGGGFTILIPDPPVEARRFELTLEPRS